MVEHLTFNQVVGGSNPPCLIKQICRLDFGLQNPACFLSVRYSIHWVKADRTIFKCVVSEKKGQSKIPQEFVVGLRDFTEFHVKAGNGSRTHPTSLGSWCTTDIRYLQNILYLFSTDRYIITHLILNFK